MIDLFPEALALLGAGVAAYTDHREGRIFNWLTLPLAAVGATFWTVTEGLTSGLMAILAGILCGFVPYLGFTASLSGESRETGGGDVKLFAALGAVLGFRLGFEAEFFSFLVASIAAVAIILIRGRVLTTLGSLFYLAFNPILPTGRRRSVRDRDRTQLRMGPFIFLGTFVAIALRHFQAGGLP